MERIYFEFLLPGSRASLWFWRCGDRWAGVVVRHWHLFVFSESKGQKRAACDADGWSRWLCLLECAVVRSAVSSLLVWRGSGGFDDFGRFRLIRGCVEVERIMQSAFNLTSFVY